MEKKEHFSQNLLNLQALREFKGEPRDFWSTYLDCLVAALGSVLGLVATKSQESGWQLIGLSPLQRGANPVRDAMVEQLNELSSLCQKNAVAHFEIPQGKLLAINLKMGSENKIDMLAVFLFDATNQQQIEKNSIVLQYLCDVPASYNVQRMAIDASTRLNHMASVLDLTVLINGETRFLSALMTFCNELASRHTSERVSIGWFKKGYIRIKAMSHRDHFDKKSEIVQSLESAMEEAFYQDAEIVCPNSGTSVVSRDHESYMRTYDISQMCSIPLRADGEIIAVCSFERNTRPFSETELRLLRLSCDQITPRLSDLKRTDRWIGALMAASLRKKLGSLVGFEHTWLKVIAILVFILLFIISFLPIPYRVETKMILRTKELTYLAVPFDGHVEKVYVRVGDMVKKDQPLLLLDQDELLLDYASILADKIRYEREAEKARADHEIADMRISKALKDQAASKLDIIQYRLDKSQIRAPSDIVVVEGDWMEKIGAPIERGNWLFKVARIDQLCAELEVKEENIHHIKEVRDGEISFLSRPKEKFYVIVERIEPMAVDKEEGNIFIVRAIFPEGYESWWRPGMTGIGKLNAGKRTLLWILTHRTVDFFRMLFWW